MLNWKFHRHFLMQLNSSGGRKQHNGFSIVTNTRLLQDCASSVRDRLNIRVVADQNCSHTALTCRAVNTVSEKILPCFGKRIGRSWWWWGQRGWARQRSWGGSSSTSSSTSTRPPSRRCTAGTLSSTSAGSGWHEMKIKIMRPSKWSDTKIQKETRHGHREWQVWS